MSWFSKLIDRLFHRNTPAPVQVSVPQATTPPPATTPVPQATASTPETESKPVTVVLRTAYQIWEDRLFGGPSTDPQEIARRANLYKNDAAMFSKVVSGPLPLAELTDDDCAYLVAMGEVMNFDPRYLSQGNFHVEVSPRLGIDSFNNMPIARFNTRWFEANKVRPVVVNVVRDMAEGTVPWIKDVFGAEATTTKLAEWKAGWERVHGGQA